MRLQNLTIIFLALALPIIIILSVYVHLQVETAFLRVKYDNALIDAAHETMVAFQINTTNDQYSNVTDKKIRDIQAALNVFPSTLATRVGATGSSTSFMMAYVPALVFTLYDGYYVYSPTERMWQVIEDEDGNVTDTTWREISTTHELKSYVHYTKQYTNDSKTKILTVSFTLDNFVSVYYYDESQKYQSRAGYLEIVPASQSEGEALLQALGNDDDVRKYYEDAWKFTKWFNDILDESGIQEAKDALTIKGGIDSNSALPGRSSNFNGEKYDVIKNSINKNLIQAMNVYGYQMPELSGNDWDLILNNVCVIAFLQGIPTGTTMYNNYTIAVSTENKELVKGEELYFIGEGTGADPYYHRIWCDKLAGDTITGYNKIEFKDQESASHRDTLACYYCIIRASDGKWDSAESYFDRYNRGLAYIELRRNAYEAALAREKLKLVPIKQSGFISGSTGLPDPWEDEEPW